MVTRKNIASDTYGPPLVKRLDAPYYTAAGMHPVAYRLMRLKLPVPGKLDVRHSFTWLRRHHVRYVIVTSAVYDRIFAAFKAQTDDLRESPSLEEKAAQLEIAALLVGAR